MKKIVITGATSMLGLSLINECISRKTHVLAITRKNSQKRDALPSSEYVKIYECNLNEIRNADYDTYGFDAFYHFAWDVSVESGRETGRNEVSKQNANIDYTLDAIQLAHKLGCTRFIGAGSQAEYGRLSGIIIPTNRVDPDNAYGIAKYSAGKLSSILAGQLSMEFIWTRIFSIYGVNDSTSTMIMYCINCLLNGEKPILTPCEQLWDYLNCRDAAVALYLLGTKGKNQGIYNIGSGITQPLKRYVYAIRDSIDLSLPLGIGERSYSPQQVMYLCPDIENLKADTGFMPSISFEEGIRETVAWCREVQNENN